MKSKLGQIKPLKSNQAVQFEIQFCYPHPITIQFELNYSNGMTTTILIPILIMIDCYTAKESNLLQLDELDSSNRTKKSIKI